MTDTQTLEGAVALLERWRYSGSMVSAQLAQLDADTVAFLALPSVSPDLPADAPRKGQTVAEKLRKAIFPTRYGYAIASSDIDAILADLNALTSAPAPSSDALRDALIKYGHHLKECKAVWGVKPGRTNNPTSPEHVVYYEPCTCGLAEAQARAALAAEEAQ